MKKQILLLFSLCFLFFLSAHALTVNVSTAGTLTTLISTDGKATITNLTLTGNIDARDFKCMRDEMPLLAVLDMGTVTIDAYTGDGGTYDDFFNKTYLANEVPRSSFTIYGSTSLIKSLTLPASLTSIGVAAIAHCSKLESITIPSKVTTIKDNAFSNCDKLTGITLPGSITSIGASAFEYCLALTSVNIPSSVQSIRGSAFNYCPNLNTIYAYPAVPIDLSSSSNVFGGVNFHVLFVPSGSVDAYKAANQWKDLTNVYDITTPVSKTIDVPTAGMLSSLLTVDEKNILVTLTLTGNIDARDVKCMRDEMRSLSNLDLSGATIQAFNGSGGTNFNLDTDTYPANQMPMASFSPVMGQNKTLKTIKLSNTLTSIGLGAFEGCKNLKTVTIPATVTSIGDGAFSTCYSLSSIYALPTSPVNISASSDVFYGVENGTCILYVSTGSKVAYQAADKWKDFTNIVEVALLPIITTNVASSITTTSTTSGGTISNAGASPVTMRGVCWSATANPTISDTKTSDGAGVGVFTSSITGLTSGLTYHIRSYATNSYGTSYGNDLTVITLGTAPTVTTTIASLISNVAATAGGNVTSVGSSPITARGICWSTTANPTVSNSKTTDGTASGVFVSSITGLTSTTTYHFRAYATNSVGTSYGEDLTFITLGTVPTVTTTAASLISTTTATSGGNVTSAGSLPVTARGVCWSTTANPTVSDSKTTDGSDLGTFVSSITGFKSNSTYHYRAYATNDIGTSYGDDFTFFVPGKVPTVITTIASLVNTTTATAGGNVTNEGSSPITAHGVCWSTTANPTTADSRTSDGSYLGLFVSKITDLALSTTYHFRAYATNEIGTSYGNDLTFTTFTTDPTVTINVSTAGTLTTLISAADKATITNLTLTGNIDARDVKCLRDEMPFLAVLDMSAANIQAYNGSGGTDSYLTSYSANKMPSYSFRIGNKSNNILKEIYFPNTITSIGEEAFWGCDALNSITIPELVTTIEDWAFSCDRLKNFNISRSLISIAENAFRLSYYIFFNVASDNLNYSSSDGILFNKDKTSLIWFPEGRYGDFIVPSTVNSIGSCAFKNCRLSSITIPPSVISINSNAFLNSSSLAIVTIPPSVKTIGEYAFGACTKLTSVNLSASVETIGLRAFASCNSISEFIVDSDNPNFSSVDGILFNKNKTSLIQFPINKNNSSYTIPNSVSSLNVSSFAECLNLTTVFIPNSVTFIGESSFYGCKNLNTIVVDKSTPIDLTTSYNTFNSVDKAKCILYVPIDSKASYQAANQWKEFTNIVEGVPPTVITSLPNSIATTTVTGGGNVISEGTYPVIGRGVCWSTSAKPTIANSKTTDGTGSGEFSSFITGLVPYVGYHVRAYATTSIGTYYGDDVICTTLGTTIDVATAGTLSSLISATDKTTLTKLILTGNIDARDVKCIRDELTKLAVLDISAVNIMAYTGMDGTQSAATSTTYPANEMPHSSFYNGNNNTGKNTLNSISLPNSITSIGAYAFEYCQGLNDNFEIPNSVISIGNSAFFGCRNMKSVMLGNKITSIGSYAFNNCSALTAFSVDLNNLNYSSSEGILFDKNKTILIQYPSAKQGALYIIPNSVASIGDDAFGDCLKLTEVIIPNSVTAIGYDAFGSCTNLSSITIPNSVTSLGGYAFGDCHDLTYVSMGNKVNLISSQAFQNCTNLRSIIIPNSVKRIDFYAFDNCAKLTSVTIPKSVTYMGNNAFSNCISLISIYAFGTIPIDLSVSSTNIFSGVNKAACTLYVPLGSKSAYQAAVQWKDFLNIVEIFPPSVSTGLPRSITTTGAKVTSTVTAEGSALVIARGVCWSTSANPTTANSITTDGSGVGEFTSSLTGLASGFTYHIRAYATNDIGTAYGDDSTFTTLYTAPTVTTTSASGITKMSAISGGEVTSSGTSTVIGRGVCWSTLLNPTIADNKTNDGTGTGAFSSSITNLTSGVTYHIRSYATTSVSTSYGSDLTFTTLGTAPTVTTAPTSSITSTSAISGGNVTNVGTSLVTARGICWSTSANPTIADNKTTDGTGAGVFSSSITGLNSAVTYHIRSYATSVVGTSYGLDLTFTTLGTAPTVTTTAAGSITSTTATMGGNVTNAGSSSVTVRGVCWSTSANPTIADNKTMDGTGSGVFTSFITGLTSAVTYHIRAYATSVVGTSYGSDLAFTTLGTAPKVTTEVIKASQTTITSEGYVTSAGTSSVTARGICWSTSANPTISDNKTTDGTGIGAFSSTISGLTSGATYHIRTYATSAVGTSYSSDLTVITVGTLPTVTTTAAATISTTSATAGGNVTSEGSSSVTFRGICWGRTINPTTADNITTDGTGAGIFSTSITGLTPGVTYHFRAYATNSVGTVYGDDVVVVTTTTGLSDEKISSIALYPNPVIDNLQIKDLDGVGSFTLSDLSGRQLINKKITNDELVSVSALPKGIYIVKIATKDGTIEKKVVKD